MPQMCGSVVINHSPHVLPLCAPYAHESVPMQLNTTHDVHMSPECTYLDDLSPFATVSAYTRSVACRLDGEQSSLHHEQSAVEAPPGLNLTNTHFNTAFSVFFSVFMLFLPMLCAFASRTGQSSAKPKQGTRIKKKKRRRIPKLGFKGLLPEPIAIAARIVQKVRYKPPRSRYRYRVARLRLRQQMRHRNAEFLRPRGPKSPCNLSALYRDWQPSTWHDLCGGAGGAAADARKRQDKAQKDSLAEALFATLAQWKEKHDASHAHADKRRKTNPTTPEPPRQVHCDSISSSTPLVDKLLSLLQQCKQQKCTDAQVASKVERMLRTRHDAVPTAEARGAAVGSAPSRKGNDAKPKPPAPPTHPKPNANHWQPHIAAEDWLNTPKLTDSKAVLQSIRENKPLPGNLVYIESDEQAFELCTYFQTYGIDQGCTLLRWLHETPVPKDYTAATVRIHWGSGQLKADSVALRFLGNVSQAPRPKPAQKVQTSAVSKISRCTLRIAAPTEYRALHTDPAQDKAKQILCEISSWGAGVPVNKMTGGQWSWQSKYQGADDRGILVGFIKMAQEDVSKLLPFSGKRGIFLNQVDTTPTRKSIQWFKKQDDESSEQYFRRCLQASEAAKQPLLYRKGGQSNLGMNDTADPKSKPRLLTLIASNVPHDWDEEEIEHFLKLQKWKEPKILSKRTRRKMPEWIIQAISPDAEGTFWAYDDEDTHSCICLTVAPARRNQAWFNQPVRGPSRGWNPETLDPKPVVGPKAPDPTVAPKHSAVESTAQKDQGPDAQTRARSRSRGRAENSGPAPHDEAGTAMQTEATQLDESQAEVSTSKPSVTSSKLLPADPTEALDRGWLEHDAGGNGDCFYRAFTSAQRAATCKNATFSPEEVARAAAEARAQVILHINKHKARFAEAYAPDPKETPERRSHQPAPVTIDDWLRNQAIATTWACGMSIQALVEKSGFPVVVWKLKNSTWQRYTFSAKFKDGQAMVCRQGHPLVLVLREGHFTFMTPPSKDNDTPIPKPWLKQGPKFHEIIDLTGAGPSQGSQTPSVHTYRTARTAAVSHRSSAKPAKTATPRPQSTARSQKAAGFIDAPTPSVHSIPGSARPRTTTPSKAPSTTAKSLISRSLTCEALHHHDQAARKVALTPSGLQAQAYKPNPVKIKTGVARKLELAQQQNLTDWTPWPCPICSQEVQVKGWNYGQYYRQKHLRAAHGAKVTDYPMPGRKNQTLRAQMRVNQGGKHHELIHVHHNGLQDCVNRGDTWICRTCLCKGTSGKVASYDCTPMRDTKRAAWWHRLKKSQRNKLADKLHLSAAKVTEISKWARKALAKRKPRDPSKGPSDADIKYRMQLKRKRAKWRKDNGLCASARQASGHANLSVALHIPVSSLGKRKRYQTE